MFCVSLIEKMKNKITVLLCFLSLATFAQKSEEIALTDFSDSYTGKLIRNSSLHGDLETNCSLNLYDKKTGKLVFSEQAFDNVFNSDYNASTTVSVNIKELPYGEQSVLIFEDFNFDGIEDIALRSGYFSCYGGPSYNVYLASKKGFEINESFTELASSNCGMFAVDYDKKQLSTMTKSGCCWHEFSTYVVENNTPVPIEIIEEAYTGIFVDYTVQKSGKGKTVTASYQSFAEGNNPEVTFVFENEKKMYLMSSMGNDLLYVFTDEEDKVELSYMDDFMYNQQKNTLSFSIKNTKYTILENEILVQVNGKEYHLNKIKSKKGSFKDLKLNEYENVQRK